MIDKTSLRIGNWVMDGETPVQIRGILNGCVNHNQASNCPYEDLNPIPLSEEVLVKLGFEDCMNHVKPHFHLEKPWIILYRENNSWRLGGRKECYLSYLHELMNLYHSLTKEELVYKP